MTDPVFDPDDDYATCQAMDGGWLVQYGAKFSADSEHSFLGFIENYDPKVHKRKNKPRAVVDLGHMRTADSIGAIDLNENARALTQKGEERKTRVKSRQKQELLDTLKAENEAALLNGT